MEEIFDINLESKIEKIEFDKSYFYIIDDFYKNPDLILNLIFENDPILWKNWQKPSYNGIYFEDYRHQLQINGIENVFDYLSSICNKNSYEKKFLTNVMRFKKNKFNDYKNNYWWPHLDRGYTAIVYLNNIECNGTNIYHSLKDDNEMRYQNEHFCPWRKKQYWQLYATIIAKFNRLVLFDASKFYHGASIDDETFFDGAFRLNQVMFFES